jgi:hypothetical protein
MSKQSDDQYTERETVLRREAALKRMLATPHKPHKPAKKNQCKPVTKRAKGSRAKVGE